MASNIASTHSPVFDRTYRINELAKIEEKITTILRSAGNAIQALTLQPLDSPESGADLESRKAAFTKAATEYFAALSYVDVHLRRQFYALEEANIIPPELPKESLTDEVDDAGEPVPFKPAVSGSMGNLDVGWLNSRNDRVGVDMQSELWHKLNGLLKDVDLNALFRESGESKSEQKGQIEDTDKHTKDKLEDDNIFSSLERHLNGLSRKK